LGGTIVPTGVYVAGDAELIEMACSRLTAPGIGSSAGINFGLGRLILQGLFLAPQIVHESLKGADMVAAVFKNLGFKVLPEPATYRSDLIQSVRLNNPDLVQKVCQSFQNSSPVDSFLNVVPSSMDGYDSNLLMAGGTFIEGSTSEFSADAPLREPYNIFVQGGSHIAHIKIALIQLLFELLEEKLISIGFPTFFINLIMSYQFPENFKYADTHEYVLEENGLLKIGVSEFAIDQLGDIVFVELAEQGKTLEKGETFGTIESVKAVEEVYLPFSGEIVSVNDSVIDNP
jgi:Cystathionine beta-lyase family protein involved in aluminum resistance